MLEDMCDVALDSRGSSCLCCITLFSLIHNVSIVLTVNTYRISCACLKDIIASKTFNRINYF